MPEGSNAVVVRPAGPGDLAAAIGLLDHLYRLEEPWRVFPPRRGIRDEAVARYRAAGSDPDSMHLVAEVGGRVVGTAYARALVAAVMEFAGSRGVERVTAKAFAGNEPALGFWSRVGFRARTVQLTAPVDVPRAGPGA